MFMGTLPTPYLEKIIVSVSLVFSDFVTIGKRIERNMKNGKLLGVFGDTSKIKKPSSNFQKKKEGETNEVMVAKRKNKARHPLPLPFYQVEAIAPN